MQGEAQHEVLVRDVDEELCGRALDDIADGLFDIGLQAGADDGCRLPRSRRDDSTEHQRGEVPTVARSQLHAEVLGAQPVQQLPHLLLRGRHGGGERRLQRAVVRHPIGGDRDVHHDVADAELVDEVAEVAEARDELGLEGAEHRFADRALAEAASEGLEVEGAVVGLVVGEPVEQAPLRHLGAPQPRPRAGALERQLAVAEERPHPAEVALERRRADMELLRDLEHVDTVATVEQRAHQPVHALAGGGRVDGGAQRGRRVRPGAVAERSRLDDETAGHARVQRRDVAADAARRDPDDVGELGGGDPVALPGEQRDDPVLARSAHVVQSTMRPAGSFRPRGKESGCPLPALSQEWP
ncbi:hypothetical protein [Microbacterium aurum]